MNKQEYSEFHKYLAILIYEYNKTFYSSNLSDESRSEVGKILNALNEVMRICIIDGSDSNDPN